MLEEVCWDVACYLGQEVGGKSSFSDVRKYSSFCFCFTAIFVLLTSASPPTLSCMELVEVQIELFLFFKGVPYFWDSVETLNHHGLSCLLVLLERALGCLNNSYLCSWMDMVVPELARSAEETWSC